jgi:hypothetical protein
MKLYLSATDEIDSLDAYHRQEIEKGLEEARAGELLDFEKVKRAWVKRLERRTITASASPTDHADAAPRASGRSHQPPATK